MSPLEVSFSIVGVVTYKKSGWGSVVIGITEANGTYHEVTAYGRVARQVDSYVYVNNTYRIDMARHDRYGLVICGVTAL